MPPAKAGSDPGAEIEAASMRHAPGLLLFWSGLAGGAAFAAVALHGVPPDAVLLADASLWLGTVCSVALMEAWVKVRSCAAAELIFWKKKAGCWLPAQRRLGRSRLLPAALP